MMHPLLQDILDPAGLIIIAVLLVGLSGAPGLFTRAVPGLGQKIAVSCITTGSIVGSCGALLTILRRQSQTFILDWTLPFGTGLVTVDPLSAFFLLPIFLISACAAVYARAYWPAAENRATEPKLTFFFGLLAGSMSLLVTAANGVFFLAAWEVMALSAYFVLTTSDEKQEVRSAGTLYMITTHIGTLALFAMFALLRTAGPDFQFPAAGSLDGTTPLAAGIFIAALIGFGLKAGLMPLHIWLPSAHANAPSHISALMSGVLIKTGIYGIIRIASFFHHPPLWWGIAILVAGVISGILGVAFAIGQHDLKRLLAYHSIENIGIIAMGIGLALIGQATGNNVLTLLGMAGALLHVLNHAIFKSLLFLSAGAVIHAVGSREIDLMGGFARRASQTATFFLIGAVAICGLPPLNGFVSEFLIYVGLFNGVRGNAGTATAFLAVAAPALALIGGLAVACFIKVYGIVFLGAPRSAEAEHAHECKLPMRAPMALLASCCAVIGLFPSSVAGLLESAVTAWQPALGGNHSLLTVAPLGWITWLGFVLVALGVAIGLVFLRQTGRRPVADGVTWDCGYLKPEPRMQYTASSFGEMLVNLFGGVLRPHSELPRISQLFPSRSRFSSHVPETVLELIYVPFLKKANLRLSVIRKLQHGQLHLYILYIFLTLIVLLVWSH